MTTYVSDIVLQFALSAVMDDLYLERVGKEFLNITAGLLEMVSELGLENQSLTQKRHGDHSLYERIYGVSGIAVNSISFTLIRPSPCSMVHRMAR